jgi:drug/metabolite transporter (DMT)-like permease
VNRYYFGVMLALLSAAGFGLLSIFSLLAYESNVTVVTILFLRFLLAALFFFVFALLQGKKEDLREAKKLPMLILGLLYTLISIFYITAVKYIPASLAALLLYLYPALVALLSFLINKEVITRRILLALVICFLGLTLVLGTSFANIHAYGLLLLVCAIVLYAFYILFSNRVVLQVSPLITSAYTTLFAALFLLVAGLFSGSLSLDFAPAGWLPILGIAFFSTIVAVFFFLWSIEIIGSTRTSILSMTEPLVTVIFAALLFSERLTFLQALGGVGILLGASLVVTARAAAPSAQTTP